MNKAVLNVLLVDDDPDFIGDFKMLLPSDYDCRAVLTVDEADRYLNRSEVDVVFLDIELGTGGNGLSYLQRLKADNPYLPVIMISADQEIQTVVKAMQLGASDYVGKSPHLDQLKISIARAIEESHFRRRYDLLESELDDLTGDMIGESEIIRSIKMEMQRLADVPSNVLITGRSGTGKELVARGIHRLSSQKGKLFLAINCPALSRELIESELFGHEKGAFTGAEARRIGKFEQVGEGTLFLDEITEIPIDVQAKLLRVLQEREFERVGGNHLIPFKGRILASTNRDIDQTVANGTLREDLLYRLNVTSIHLPLLSERRDDIPLLIDYFVQAKSREMKRPVPNIEEEASRLLSSYDWPGNVRELSNCIESAIVHTDRKTLGISDFGRCMMSSGILGSYEETKKKFMDEFQRNYINAILQKNEGNITKTAKDMGVTRQGLVKMMKNCGLRQDDE